MSNTIFIEPKCKICGQCFKSLAPIGKHLKLKHNISVEIYYKRYIDNTEYKCLTCNKPVSFISLTLGYRKFCCSACASQNKTWLLNREKTYIKKYGAKSYTATDECKNKIKQTCLEKYGVENYSQTIEYKNRCKQTCLEKYGVNSFSQTPEYILKTKETNNKKYGKDYFLQTAECLEKRKQTCLEKYGVENYVQTELDDLAEAKHQCMIKNNIKIITDIKPYI